MKVAIFGNKYQSDKHTYAKKLIKLLQKEKVKVTICSNFYHSLYNVPTHSPNSLEILKENEPVSADIAISMGGDGTFLRTANRIGDNNIPILGINTGRLGFLADISPEEIEVAVDELLNQHYTIEERTVLKLSVAEKKELFALNEVAILKRDTSSMISIETTINNTFLTTYQADGLIIATPTGSTAYSLSVGGPIIAPNSNTVVITPVAPHSLNIRPVVVCDHTKIELKVSSRSHNFLISVDGKSYTCKEGTVLNIQKAGYTVKVIKRHNHQFFSTLRSKLMWGADKRL